MRRFLFASIFVFACSASRAGSGGHLLAAIFYCKDPR